MRATALTNGSPYSAVPSTSCSSWEPARTCARGRRRTRCGSPRAAGRRALEAHLVPADVGQLQARRCELAHLAGDDPEPLARRPARWSARTRAASRGRPRAPASPARTRSRRSSSSPSRAAAPSPAGTRPTPGRRGRRGASALGSRAHERARADVLERLLHRAAVAHAVVDEPDLGHGLVACRPRRRGDVRIGQVSVPLVLGTPVSVGSIATACAALARTP